jgi:ribokinase
VSSAFDVCIVGSANLDLVAGTDRHPAPGETVLGHSYAEHPGGKGLNQAAAAARSGATVAFVGALGNDAAGARLRQVLADEMIDATGVATVDAPTGRAMIVVDSHGENSIVVVPGANHAVELGELPAATVVLVQLEIPLATVEAALRAGRASGARTILNPAPAAPLPARLLELVDIAVPNQHEELLLGGAAALLAHGCTAVLVTRGAEGVDIHTADGVTHIAAFEVDAIDTTGAGDAFCGSLAARLAAGDDLPTAARWAAAAGALATTVAGAVPAQPSAVAVRALLDAQSAG